MSQITLYFDDATQLLVEQAATASGMSKSRWVAECVRKHAGHEWPKNVIDLAGRFADFPLREDASSGRHGEGAQVADVPRLGF